MQRTYAQSLWTWRNRDANATGRRCRVTKTTLQKLLTGCLVIQELWKSAGKRALFMSLSSRLWDRGRRLANMGWDELRVRTQQEIAKRWDLAVGRIGSHLQKESDSQSLRSSGRFFFACDEVP